MVDLRTHPIAGCHPWTRPEDECVVRVADTDDGHVALMIHFDHRYDDGEPTKRPPTKRIVLAWPEHGIWLHRGAKGQLLLTFDGEMKKARDERRLRF